MNIHHRSSSSSSSSSSLGARGFARVVVSAVAIALASIGASAGCSSVANHVKCADICDKYQSCFDTKYDTSACHDRCTDSANKDSAFQNKVDVCSACIGDKSCVGATFSCATDCGGIVP